ncbi:MAG: aspartate-semialdehyde dehydrogenase [Bdellovibrionales bacterium]|nr:aspartate-semialdehyde dehydrogenase [Bdellovibrionales bacterium]
MRNIEDLTVAVVGATGAVGREMLAVLGERDFPVGNLRPLASARSAGERVSCGDVEAVVEELNADSFAGVDIALFSAGSTISKEFGPIAAARGAVVIDNSSCFRMEQGVPLVVPEVNSELVADEIQRRGSDEGFIIANPNCSTIQLVVVLHPIEKHVGIERVVVSTYQSVSGAGKKGMDELWDQTRGIFSQQAVEPSKFPHQIAFNCLPQIDVFEDNGYTKEETKVIKESRKILGIPDLRITATAVRVPVFTCHSESVNIETRGRLSAEDARALLMESPGIIVIDEPETGKYPMGCELGGTDATYVGRIRADESAEHGLNMWIVADNLRKGAALNAVQIAEVVVDAWGSD